MDPEKLTYKTKYKGKNNVKNIGENSYRKFL